jgi:hypothetical protein
MSNGNTTPAATTAPKRRGRKPRSVVPVTYTVQVKADAKMKGRIENMIDDLPQTGEIVAENTNTTGFTLVVKYATGPEGRLSRKAIIANLTKMKDKGRIAGWTVATNVVSG